mgnify:CR=1 FL=1
MARLPTEQYSVHSVYPLDPQDHRVRVREERLRQHPRRAVERTRVRQRLDNNVLDGSRAFELGPDVRRRVEEPTPQRQPRLTLRSKLRHELLRWFAARDHGGQLGVRVDAHRALIAEVRATKSNLAVIEGYGLGEWLKDKSGEKTVVVAAHGGDWEGWLMECSRQ